MSEAPSALVLHGVAFTLIGVLAAARENSCDLSYGSDEFFSSSRAVSQGCRGPARASRGTLLALESGSQEGLMAKYCPECRTECGASTCGGVDERGRCRRCGKPPVDSTEQSGRWLWCTQHDQWHRQSCSADATTHCCTGVAA